MPTFTLASSNPSKLHELSHLLAPLDVQLVAQSDLGIKSIDESGHTFVENALAKARHACKHALRPALADDSGLVVPALGGAPGIFSARYAGVQGDDEGNNAKLLAQMESFSGADRRCFFYCVLVLVQSPNDPCPLIAEGRFDGRVAHTPAGSAGFGYDPIVCVADSNQRVAELSLEHKNQISHRARALKRLYQQMQDLPLVKPIPITPHGVS